MRMDTRLPLMVQPPDFVNALAMGTQAAAQQNEVNRLREMQNFLTQSGGALIQGDQNALAQYAQFDPNAALGIMDGRQAMDARALGMDATRLDMDAARQQMRLAAEEAARTMSAQERQEQLAALESTMSQAAGLYEQARTDPNAIPQFNAYMEQAGLGVTYEQFPMLAATMEPVAEALANYREITGAGAQGEAPAAFQALDLRAQAAGLVPGTPEYQQFMLGGGGAGETININTGPTGIDYGRPDAGLVWQRDPATGDVVLDERGAPVAIPYQNGPAWQDQQAAQAEAAATAQQQTAEQNQQATVNNIVLTDLGRAKSIIDNAAWYNPPAGFGSGGAEAIRGSNAANLNSLLDTVRANIGFDRLQAMRDASPTGGALGSITERELSQLQAVLGSLTLEQSPAQLRENIERLERIYTGIAEKAAAYPNASDFGFADAAQSATPAGDQAITPQAIMQMTPQAYADWATTADFGSLPDEVLQAIIERGE
jgi:hypothetical protein